MGLSGFKIMLVLGVIIVLFLPTFVKRSEGLPQAFQQLRARLSGEPVPEPAEPALPVAAPPPRPSFAERVGGWIGRMTHRRRA